MVRVCGIVLEISQRSAREGQPSEPDDDTEGKDSVEHSGVEPMRLATSLEDRRARLKHSGEKRRDTRGLQSRERYG